MRKLLLVWLLAMASGAVVGQGYFHGYRCTDDCSGHEAGYEYAERYHITDPDDCGGNSQSFIEGCMAYAEEYGGYKDDDEEAIANGDCEDEDEDGECDEDW